MAAIIITVNYPPLHYTKCDSKLNKELSDNLGLSLEYFFLILTAGGRGGLQ